MNRPLDAGMELYRQVLDLRAYRQKVLAVDIANSSTPRFKAVDLDFKTALEAVGGGGDGRLLMLVVDPRHLRGPSGSPAPQDHVKYEAGGAVTLDGNSVDLDRVKLESAENAVDYEAAATFLGTNLNMLLTSIRGAAAAGGGR